VENTEDGEEELDLQMPPKHFKIVQNVCLSIMAIILLLLVVFIVYISATWNKYRGNEYS